MSKKIVIGNWKMNPITQKEAERIFSKIIKTLFIKKSEVVICPPSIYLKELKSLTKKIQLGVQNIYSETNGSFTGEIGAEMSLSVGAKYVILGHSERRAMGEDNLFIAKKVKIAIASGLVPIVCIGEDIRDDDHEYLNYVKRQLLESLVFVSKNFIDKIIIAYEPVWAIGKNAIREATGEEFREMRIFIKKILSDKFGAEVTNKIRIIYGGSVNPKNALEFLQVGETDGFLVGRDSLNPEKFLKIINIIENEVN